MVRRDDDGGPAGKPDGKQRQLGIPTVRDRVVQMAAKLVLEPYFLHRQPSLRAMKRIRQKVREKTQRRRCHADLREVIADLNPILRGWGAYFGTGNAARCFTQIDDYVRERLHGLRVKRAGRQLDARTASTWTREYFESLGPHRLRGTVRYPEATQYRWRESPPASRVRENRMHGFNGGRMETRSSSEGK